MNACAFAVKIQVIKGALNIEGPRAPVQVLAQPVIHLEGKNIRCGTDLEHHIVGPSTVNGAVGDQEQVMFVGRFSVDILFNLHWGSLSKTALQLGAKGAWINILTETQVHPGAWLAIEDVVGLILGKRFTKALTNVLRSRMALHGQVSTIKRI